MATPLSIQLYTLRDEVRGDFAAVLRQVAEIGYKGVEFAGLHGHSPEEVAGLVRDLGLQVSSSHVGLPTKETIRRIADTEKALGNTRLVAGFGPNDFQTLDDCKRSADLFQTAAELAKSEGLTFGMHNHWWEFETRDGTLVYDFVLETAPDIFSELDIYWAAYAKSDPVQVITKHKSRLPLLHIKDGMLEENGAMTAIGNGKLNIPAIILAADSSVLNFSVTDAIGQKAVINGTPDADITLQWLIVELDRCDTDIWEAVRQSYTYLTEKGLAVGNR